MAAAFAGFSGVVAALGHRSPSDWSPAACFRRGRKVRARGGDLSRWMAVVWMGGMLGVAAAQVVGIAMPGPSRGALYVAGILVLLAISGLQFILLALGSVDEKG